MIIHTLEKRSIDLKIGTRYWILRRVQPTMFHCVDEKGTSLGHLVPLRNTGLLFTSISARESLQWGVVVRVHWLL